jgi:hypothetical protein
MPRWLRPTVKPLRRDRHPSLLRISRVVLGSAGVLFLVISLARNWTTWVGHVEINGWRLVLAMGLLLAAGVLLARSWAAVLAGLAPPGKLTRGYLRSQPAKYIPGGWAQPVSQVVHAAGDGAHIGMAATAYPVQAVCLFVSGAVLGVGVVALGEAPDVLRCVSPIGVLTVILLSRRWMAWIVGLLGRLLGKAGWEELVPAQAAIWRCFAWSLGAIGLMAAAFAVLADSSYGSLLGPLGAISVFAFAWAVGFAALPFPAGVGVREAVLAGVLGGTGPGSLVVGLSILHRALQMLAELALLLVSRFRSR